MRIGIVIAMKKEFDLIVKSIENQDTRTEGHFTFTWGELGKHSIVAILAGIGKVNAALGTTMLIYHARPDCILSVGCSGALNKSLEVGDVINAHEVAYHDVWCGEGNEIGQIQGCPAKFQCNPKLSDELTTSGNIKALGLFLSGEYFIPTPRMLQQISINYEGALAVDMESAAVAQTCWIEGYPFSAIRAISDTPCKPESNPAVQYETFWKNTAEMSFANIMKTIKNINQ